MISEPQFEELFEQALELPPSEFEGFLRKKCGKDDKLRSELLSLLDADRNAGRFLEDVNRPCSLQESEIGAISSGTNVGPYRLCEPIGEGGFGVVFAAEQEAPVRRRVALKLLKPNMNSKSILARFDAERQALALMDHTNIAKVLDAGTTELGVPYFAMEFVPGVSVTDYCDERSLTTRNRLELFVTICLAVQHAHQKGVIHRDIKPGNVLVTEIDGKPVPKIIDFGIAKAIAEPLTDEKIQTHFAEMIGTPLYMSPEQAQMGAVDVDTRSDVYSLGALLYELLTGHPPFRRNRLRQVDVMEQLRIIREEEPCKPSASINTLKASELSTISSHRGTHATRLRGSIRGELDWIVMKAQEKDRGRRYESPSALARDIERHLTNEPIEARRPSAAYRFQKLIRRNKFAFMSACLVLMALFMGAIGTGWQALKAQEAYASEKIARREAEANLKWANFRARPVRYAGWRKEIHKFIHANPSLHKQYPVILQGIDAVKTQHFAARASSVAFDTEGSRLAMGGTAQQAASVWDEQGKRHEFSTVTTAGLVAFTTNGTAVQLSTRGPKLELRSLKTGKRIEEFTFSQIALKQPSFHIARSELEYPVAALSSNATFVAAAADFRDNKTSINEGVIAVWNGTGKKLHQFKQRASALAIAPDGSLLAAGDGTGRITVWSLTTGKIVGQFQRDHNRIFCLTFQKDVIRERKENRDRHHDNWLVASGHKGGTIVVWDLQQRSVRALCRGSLHDVFQLAFDPSGMFLASCGRAHAIIWDPTTGEMLLKLNESPYLSGLAWSADGKRLAISTDSGVNTGVTVWSLDFGRGIRTLRGLVDAGAKVAFSPNGRYLAALSHTWHIAIWDLHRNRLLHLIRVPPGQYVDNAAMAFNRDGSRFAFAAGTSARIWNVDTGQAERTWTLPIGLQDRLVFHPTAGRLLSVRCEAKDSAKAPFGKIKRVCRLRDLTSDKPLQPVAEISTFQKHVYFIAAARNGSVFVIDGIGEDGVRRATAFEGLTAKPLWSRTLDGLNPSTRDIPISPTQVGLPATNSHTLIVSIQTGRVRDVPFAVTAIHDDWLAVVSEDRVTLRKGAVSSSLLTLPSHRIPSNYESQFSNDGRLLAWSNRDGTVTVADLAEIQRRVNSLRTN